MGLTKATLQKLSSVTAGGSPGDEIPVQFNPTSLRLATNNQTEGQQRLSHRSRQYLARGSTKLTLQLVFDTADEGNGDPVSVRTKTRLVTQFLEPQREGRRQSPPALRFHWGELIFEGIMDSATEDIDLFASNGTPLRAKVDVQITGQRLQDLELTTGPGGTDGGGDAPTPGEMGSGEPGTEGGGGNDRTATAHGGESAAAFAARNGVNPAAWRSFADQVPDPLSLPAGLPIVIGAAASAAAGIGSSGGIQAGNPVQPSAALSAARAATTSTTATASTSRSNDERRAAFALAAVGGVAQAIDGARGATATAAADQSRRAFDAPGAKPASSPAASAVPGAAGVGPSTAGQSGGLRRAPATATTAASTTTTARAAASDPASRWYGFGVPLRQRIAPAAASRAATVVGARTPVARTVEPGPPTTDDPTIAPWTRLPRRDQASRFAERVSSTRRPKKPCGCGGGCGCGCGGH